MYNANVDQKFNGQRAFKTAIENRFVDVWTEVMADGFQTGWKTITGCPQHGNHNPNWKDCMRFVQAVLLRESLVEKYEPVDMPFEKNFDPKIRGCLENKAQWHLLLEVCKVYQELAKRDGQCKRKGYLDYLYNNGHIALSNNDYGKLWNEVQTSVNEG